MLPFVKVAVHCPIQNTVQVIGLINYLTLWCHGGEAISVEKIYGKMTYVSIHRNPLVTQSVPKVGTEVLKPTLGTNWYSSTCGLGTLFVPRVRQYFCVTTAILLAFSSNANIGKHWVRKVCPTQGVWNWNRYYGNNRCTLEPYNAIDWGFTGQNIDMSSCHLLSPPASLPPQPSNTRKSEREREGSHKGMAVKSWMFQ